jgi:Tol biopolymer transport system component
VLVPSTMYWPSSPKWSPDGNEILFTYNAGKSSSSEAFYNLWVINPDGTGQTQLTHDILVLRARWSPDGRWIAFDGPIAYEEPNPDYELWLIDGTGSTLKRLTSNTVNKASEAMPTWSPDGDRIFFVRGKSLLRGEYEVWMISLADGTQTRLPSSVTSDFFMLW